jgi:hypothetical protein
VCKEYYGVPRWFIRGMRGAGMELLNCRGCKHYIGSGFDIKKKTWTDGVWLSDFEYTTYFWQNYIAGADFIIHFGETV